MEAFQADPDNAIRIQIGDEPVTEIERSSPQLAFSVAGSEVLVPAAVEEVPPKREDEPEKKAVPIDTAPMVELGLSAETIAILTEKTGKLRTGERVIRVSTLRQFVPESSSNPGGTLNNHLGNRIRYKQIDLEENPWEGETDGRTAFISLKDASEVASSLTGTSRRKKSDDDAGAEKKAVPQVTEAFEQAVNASPHFENNEKAWLISKLGASIYTDGSNLYLPTNVMETDFFKGNRGSRDLLRQSIKNRHADWFLSAAEAGIEGLDDHIEVITMDHALLYIRAGNKTSGMGLKMD
jgi:hypothetical protein